MNASSVEGEIIMSDAEERIKRFIESWIGPDYIVSCVNDGVYNALMLSDLHALLSLLQDYREIIDVV